MHRGMEMGVGSIARWMPPGGAAAHAPAATRGGTRMIAAAPSISGWRTLPGQPRLVGQDDELYPVPRTELGEQVMNVCLDRCLGHHEFGGDLRVGQALGNQGEHLALPAGGAAEALLAGRGRAVVAARCR